MAWYCLGPVECLGKIPVIPIFAASKQLKRSAKPWSICIEHVFNRFCAWLVMLLAALGACLSEMSHAGMLCAGRQYYVCLLH